MCGAVHPLPQFVFMAWYLFKHRDNFTLPPSRAWQLSSRVLGNRVLRRTFGPKREEVTGGWRRLHNEELHNLDATPDTVGLSKLRRMRSADYVARMREM
jgi:hypothetical protein